MKRLFQAIIIQALHDMRRNSRSPEDQFHQREATYWLLEDKKDFFIVCELAEVCPKYVRNHARVLSRPLPEATSSSSLDDSK